MELKDPKEPRAPQPKIDAVQKLMGQFGKYQFLLCLLIFLAKPSIAYHQMAIIFLAPKIKYTCPDTNSQSCPCSNPTYDTSIFSNSIIMQWNLICNNQWLVGFTQTLFQLGTLVGSVFFGMASDRFGRKKPLIFAVFLQCAAALMATYMPEYWSFTIFRFVVGLSVGGTMVCTFVLLMEFIGTKYRDLISAIYQAPFNLGHMLLPLYGYFFRDYKDFHLCISILSLVQLVFLCLLPETPRWCLAVKRTKDAIKIIEKVAKVNKLPTENIAEEINKYQVIMQERNLKKGTIMDLFRTPNLRKNTLVMAFNWLACSYCFYGVSQYVGHLSGDPFINVACSAAVTLFGTLMSFPLMKVLGRKPILITSNFVCGICLLLLAMIPRGVASVVLACIGVVTSFIVFVIVYLYSGELFPTVVRNAGIGFSSMMARVGSMIAPFVIDLQGYAIWAPPLCFAIVPLIAGVIAFLLPETKNCELMNTIEEGENFGKKNRQSTS